jgi:hypothetical protein
MKHNHLPHIEIIAQPCAKYRMRYGSEKRKRNFLTANDSTKKSFPSIKLINCKQFSSGGYLQIVCVCKTPTNDAKYHVHPNQLTGKHCKDYGVAWIKFKSDTETIELKELGIEHVLSENINGCVEKYKENNVDPYGVGYDHINKKRDFIDLNSVKLCFQLFFLVDGKVVKSDPVVSDTIYSGTQKELIIEQVINQCGSVYGGSSITLLIKKISLPNLKKHIWVKFFSVDWVKLVDIDFNHFGCTLVFKAPEYYNVDIIEPLDVCFQVFMKTDIDEFSSEVCKFTYEPVINRFNKRLMMDEYLSDNFDGLFKKQKKIDISTEDHVNELIESNPEVDLKILNEIFGDECVDFFSI